MLNSFYAGLLASGFVLSACAETAQDVAPAQVSTKEYDRLTCRQIAKEAMRVTQEAQAVSVKQNEVAKRDAVAKGVAWAVLGPAALLIKTNELHATELARLKGELNALEQVSGHKNCGITFQKARAAASG
ncbi:hypothetical protein [Pseudosulfitobacter koreensis]|uniref:Lipoprotein n=1 Tax=Pseudosulfitobacter koreensis TaxID=2968472 RepID=A0ABT1Z2M6_9RHOB|nr:hypothetical protein [Pseudosulfitobacter koreense]MCR8827396.1 hypothetical protein [Pseudosulfitobacter koreense]